MLKIGDLIMIERREAIKIIFDQKKGNAEDLRRQIGTEYFNQFCLMGLIKCGVASVNDTPVNTWSMTDTLKNEYDFFFEVLSDKDKAIANYFAPASFHR